jgi:hypothetical protein
MDEKLKTIIKNVISAYGINCKRINRENLEIERRYYRGGYQYTDYIYRMPNAKKWMRIAYDEDRGMEEEVNVYSL